MSRRHAPWPVLRLTGSDSPVPPGYVAVPVGGDDRGQAVEVVYDAGRYDILVVHGSGGGMFPRLTHEASAELVLEALALAGWELHSVTNDFRLWVRDRVAAERIATQRREQGRRARIRIEDVGPETCVESASPWTARPQASQQVTVQQALAQLDRPHSLIEGVEPGLGKEASLRGAGP